MEQEIEKVDNIVENNHKIIEERISDIEYVEELPEDYIEVAPGTEGTGNLESKNIE